MNAGAVEIPVRRPSEGRPEPSPGRPQSPSPARPRIMIVDDDSAFRETLRALLTREGFDVVGEAGDGAQAVEEAQRMAPDVVLMDLRMPIVDGLSATRSIKSLLPLVQVIMLSAYGDPGLQRGAEDAGVYCYLIKGCPPQMIRDMLRFAWSYKVGVERTGPGAGPAAGRPASS